MISSIRPGRGSCTACSWMDSLTTARFCGKLGPPQKGKRHEHGHIQPEPTEEEPEAIPGPPVWIVLPGRESTTI